MSETTYAALFAFMLLCVAALAIEIERRWAPLLRLVLWVIYIITGKRFP
jgi:hypothetical protein